MSPTLTETALSLGTATVFLFPAMPATGTVPSRRANATDTTVIEEIASPSAPAGPATVLTGQARIDKINELCGKYRDLLPSSEEFNLTKHLDW